MKGVIVSHIRSENGFVDKSQRPKEMSLWVSSC
jgi:hypothetical protein